MGELVPHRGIAAILHKGTEIRGQILPAEHHRGRCAHGHPMDHQEIITPDIMGHFAPAAHIQAVQPSHLDGPALGQAMIMQIGHHHVVIQAVTVHPHQVQEADVVIGIAMHHHSRSLRFGRTARRCKDGMQPIAVFPDQGGIAKDAAVVQAVVPRDNSGIAGLGFGPVSLQVVAMFCGEQGIIAHVPAHQAAAHAQHHGQHQDGSGNSLYSHFARSLSVKLFRDARRIISSARSALSVRKISRPRPWKRKEYI